MKNLTLLFFLAILVGCKGPEYLTKPKDFKYYVKGLYMDAALEGEKTNLIGEIIEVKDDYIKILPLYQLGGIRTIPRHEIKKADIIVAGTSDEPKKIGGWAAAINLGSIGHGLFGIITLPINIAITASIANNAAHSSYRMNYPKNVQWDGLYKFARFPQGIPGNIAEREIK